MRNIIRNINLKNFTLKKLTNKEENYVKAISFFKIKIEKIKTYKPKDFPNWRSYGKAKNKIIFDYDGDRDFLYVSMEDVWNILLFDYNLTNSEIRDIIKHFLLPKIGLVEPLFIESIEQKHLQAPIGK